MQRSADDEGVRAEEAAGHRNRTKRPERCRGQRKRGERKCSGRQMTKAFAPRKLPGTAIGLSDKRRCKSFNSVCYYDSNGGQKWDLKRFWETGS